MTTSLKETDFVSVLDSCNSWTDTTSVKVTEFLDRNEKSRDEDEESWYVECLCRFRIDDGRCVDFGRPELEGISLHIIGGAVERKAVVSIISVSCLNYVIVRL